MDSSVYHGQNSPCYPVVTLASGPLPPPDTPVRSVMQEECIGLFKTR